MLSPIIEKPFLLKKFIEYSVLAPLSSNKTNDLSLSLLTASFASFNWCLEANSTLCPSKESRYSKSILLLKSLKN